MKKFGFLLLTCMLFISCSENNDEPGEQITPLVADFSFEFETIDENSFMGIENKSEGATLYTWDFGNGNVYTDEIPDFRFLTHGIYDVSLTVENDLGETQSITKSINVLCVFGGGIEHSEF